ncbi:MAG: hypothetical protein AseanaTS_07570 [Candidatus Pelagadaptatus aseana]
MKSLFMLTTLTLALPSQASEDNRDLEQQAQKLMAERCIGCHTKNDDGSWRRISEQRKTPEGWLMNLVRMQKIRGAYLTTEERDLLVKYLSDTQGLAPEETADYRYILERRENTPENWQDPNFGEMCARCHSGARVAIQRRSEAEWKRNIHFHLGQWTSTEYSYQGRDREWFKIAEEITTPLLAQRYPLHSEAWNEWQQHPKAELQGRWRWLGHQPGRGNYEGYLTIEGGEKDQYRLSFEGRYLDGEEVTGTGSAVLYTGYEWRASITLNGVQQQQVMALSKDGMRLSGRMFVADENEKGTDLQLDRSDAPRIMGIYPAHVKSGSEAQLTIVGHNLDGNILLPESLSVIEELERSAGRITLRVAASADQTTHRAPIAVGEAGGELVIYKNIDSVAVEPAYGVARVGGGHTPKVHGIFEAVGIAAGNDGLIGSEDDIRIGYFPAKWSVEPFDEIAKHDHDVDFAGTMNADTGVFTPGDAGPNPKRRFSTNNAGNLKVVAEVADGDKTLKGDGRMVVTVQRWNNSPIR